MANVYPYHTDSQEDPPTHRDVYHDHDECSEGKKILFSHKKSGTGGKPRCKECEKLG